MVRGDDPGTGPAGRVLARLGRGLRRITGAVRRLRPLTVAAVLSVAAVLGTTVLWSGGRPDTGDASVGDVVRVGVGQGDSIPDYLRASRAELAGLRGTDPSAAPDTQTYALVTLSEYLSPDRLAVVLRGVALDAVYVRVPLPRVQTQILRISAFRVPDDVSAGMREAATRKEREAADYRRLGDAVAGQGPEQRWQREVYGSGAQVADAEARALRASCACVYAAVVRARVAILDDMAGRAQVRAVDAAPEVRRLDRAVFLPPLPEQADVVRPPVDDRLPVNPARPTAEPSREVTTSSS